MPELTPAQECAVEIGRANAEYHCPGEYTDMPDDYFLGNEVPPSTPDIISRYIREAEQRGREKAADEVAQLRGSKDTAYAERNKMVSFLSRLYPSHLKRHPESDTEWEDDWRNIVCVHGPAGQMTWHIHDSECHLYQHLNVKQDPLAGCEYDGHTTYEKYQRLFSCLAAKATPEAPHD